MAVIRTDLGRRFFKGVAQGRYLWLSVTLFATVIFAPLMKELSVGVRLADVLLLAVVVASLRSAVPHRRWLVALVVLAVLVGGLMIVHYAAPSTIVQVLLHLPLLALLLSVTGLILADILLTPRVNADTIAGAVCVYLQLGFTFAVLYSLCSLLVPNAFELENHLPVSINFLSDGFGNAVYFSFVTLTTVGYGDIVPRAEIVKSLSIVEAMTGQLFLTILVARLVGMHITLPGEPNARFGPDARR